MLSDSNEKTKLSTEPKKFYFLNNPPPTTSSNNQAQSSQSPLEIDHGTEDNLSYWSWITSIFFRPRDGYQLIDSKPRRVPVKVEPKVFFANERTFLAWLHMAVTLASISMAIVA
jgi:hypothetical protein